MYVLFAKIMQRIPGNVRFVLIIKMKRSHYHWFLYFSLIHNSVRDRIKYKNNNKQQRNQSWLKRNGAKLACGALYAKHINSLLIEFTGCGHSGKKCNFFSYSICSWKYSIIKLLSNHTYAESKTLPCAKLQF